MIQNYKRGSNLGGISSLNTDGSYGACTATESKHFKTLAKAQKWLASKGYTEEAV